MSKQSLTRLTECWLNQNFKLIATVDWLWVDRHTGLYDSMNVCIPLWFLLLLHLFSVLSSSENHKWTPLLPQSYQIISLNLLFTPSPSQYHRFLWYAVNWQNSLFANELDDWNRFFRFNDTDRNMQDERWLWAKSHADGVNSPWREPNKQSNVHVSSICRPSKIIININNFVSEPRNWNFYASLTTYAIQVYARTVSCPWCVQQ